VVVLGVAGRRAADHAGTLVVPRERRHDVREPRCAKDRESLFPASVLRQTPDARGELRIPPH